MVYVLASVILGLCGIGVFAPNNVAFGLWTLFWFGILGFVMRQFGFPLAPMILGVVLGNIAELNLACALAIRRSGGSRHGRASTGPQWCFASPFPYS